MTDGIKKLINDVIKNNKIEEVNNEIVEKYFELIDVIVDKFFLSKKYKLSNDNTLRTYNTDLYSMLSIVEIQEKMLSFGLDFNYSLYSMGGYQIDQFKEKYLEFSRIIDVYKLQLNKKENIEKLKLINNLAKQYLNSLIKS